MIAQACYAARQCPKLMPLAARGRKLEATPTRNWPIRARGGTVREYSARRGASNTVRASRLDSQRDYWRHEGDSEVPNPRLPAQVLLSQSVIGSLQAHRSTYAALRAGPRPGFFDASFQ